MNSLQMKYFLRVAELSSISKAAHEYHIASSAISNHIKALEQELGTEFFDRNGNQMTLNSNGKILYEYGQKILCALDDAEKEIADANGRLNYNLKISTLTIPRTIPIIVKRFKEHYPELKLQISQYQKYNEKLDYDSDVVIYSTEIPLRKENSCILYEEPILLAVSKEHPLAGEKEIEIKRLANEKFIRRSEFTDFRRNIEDRYFEAFGIHPSTAIVTDYPPLINKLVALNFGIAFMAQLTCMYAQEELVPLRIKGVDLRRYINISWKNHGYRSVATKLFVDFTVDFFKNLNFGA